MLNKIKQTPNWYIWMCVSVREYYAPSSPLQYLAQLYDFLCISELILFFPTIFDNFPPLIPDMSFLTHATFNRCVRFTISINPNYHTMRLILLSFRFHRWRPWVTKKLSSLPKITFPRFSSESLAHVLHLQP